MVTPWPHYKRRVVTWGKCLLHCFACFLLTPFYLNYLCLFPVSYQHLTCSCLSHIKKANKSPSKQTKKGLNVSLSHLCGKFLSPLPFSFLQNNSTFLDCTSFTSTQSLPFQSHSPALPKGYLPPRPLRLIDCYTQRPVLSTHPMWLFLFLLGLSLFIPYGPIPGPLYQGSCLASEPLPVHWLHLKPICWTFYMSLHATSLLSCILNCLLPLEAPSTPRDNVRN